MLPEPNAYGGWCASGEIDIMEHINYADTPIHGTLHFGGVPGGASYLSCTQASMVCTWQSSEVPPYSCGCACALCNPNAAFHFFIHPKISHVYRVPGRLQMAKPL